MSSREHFLEYLFPDLSAEFDDLDNSSNDVLLAFKDQRQEAVPNKQRKDAARRGPESDPGHGRRSGLVLRVDQHCPCRPAASSLAFPRRLDQRAPPLPHLFNLEEFTEMVNRCAPNALVRISFAILRTLVTTRYRDRA